jgi:hypothetical protein
MVGIKISYQNVIGVGEISIENTLGFSIENLSSYPIGGVLTDQNIIQLGFQKGVLSMPVKPESSRPFMSPSNTFFTGQVLHYDTKDNIALITLYHIVNLEVNQ